ILCMRAPLFRHELHKHLFEAQTYGTQLQKLPALLDDRLGYVGPHIPLLGGCQGIDRRTTRISAIFRHRQYSWQTLQVRLYSLFWALHFQMDGAIGLRPLGEMFWRVDCHDLTIIDDHHTVTGHTHFRQDMGAEDDRVLVSEAFNG